ncbi:MAG: ATP-dependent sacrificial sulfur transferase LarE, partial [Desulfuromonadaceae bacterium]|nr:ATP-dependent sacrificial sulfur transferase LarE [Desulfuromonadaceae bacterium]
MDLAGKLENLEKAIRSMERVLVCFSGGADSSLLLFLCARLLGAEQVTAFTVVSQASWDEEVAACRNFSAHLKVPLIIASTDILGIREIKDGDPRRCYFCKKNIFELAGKEARSRGIGIILEGSNLDDRDDYRPGFAAIEEFAVRSPLLEAGLTKEDVRGLSRRLTLPTWDKPATTCLLTRFPYGVPVTEEGLLRIKKCEGFLRDHGFTLCRVRGHNELARIEVAEEDIPRFADPQL